MTKAEAVAKLRKLVRSGAHVRGSAAENELAAFAHSTYLSGLMTLDEIKAAVFEARVAAILGVKGVSK